MLNYLIAGTYIIIAFAFIVAVMLVVGWLLAGFVLAVTRVRQIDD